MPLFAALPPKMPTRSENAFHLFLNSREQRHRFADNMSIRQAAPLRIFEREPLFFSAQFHLPIELIENSMRRLWQHWRNPNRNDAQGLGEGIQNIVQYRFIFLITRLREFPR